MPIITFVSVYVCTNVWQFEFIRFTQIQFDTISVNLLQEVGRTLSERYQISIKQLDELLMLLLQS